MKYITDIDRILDLGILPEVQEFMVEHKIFGNIDYSGNQYIVQLDMPEELLIVFKLKFGL
jgi:hypothetical protein